MKKSLIALFVAAFCFSSMAQTLVYDYSASIKRLDVSLVKVDKSGAKLDSAKVKSDKLEGVVLINACKNCTDGTAEYMEKSTDDTNKCYVFVALKSNKAVYAKDEAAKMYFAMWGKKTGTNKTTGAWFNADKFSDATGYLTFDLSAYKDFWGFDSTKASFVANGGFGKVSKQTSSVTVTDPCLGDTTYTYYCWTLKDLSGSTLSNATYTGECGYFLFDVCDLDTPKTADYAAIPGTFTLKYNKSLSADFANTPIADAAAIVENSLIADGMVEAAK